MHALLHVLKVTRTYMAHTAKAKQAIFIFAPRDQKCLVHSRVLTVWTKAIPKKRNC